MGYTGRFGGVTVRALILALVLSAGAAPARAGEAEAAVRLVVLKFDGLAPEMVERYVHMPDPRTGRTILPWIEHLFYKGGVRFSSFYARGMSLSMTSWAILDTGHHSVIKGNWEVDRNTGEPADYLNTLHFHLGASRARSVYPVCVEMLDAARVPLVADAFQFEERRQGIQLLRRGTMFADFLDVGLQTVKGPIRDRVGELLSGIDFEDKFDAATREDLRQAILDPKIRYVDYYNPYVDHLIHDDNDEQQILRALRQADQVIGEAHAAIVESGTAERTVLVVVSDHGITYDLGGRYSHGLNLVPYLNSRAFGAHNVLTRRGPLSQYTLQGSIFKPLPPLATLARAPEPFFLEDRPDQATCAVDNDGNERAQIHFRHPELNRLQMLRQALESRGLDEAERAAVERAALAVVERNRAAWETEAREVREELSALAARKARYEAELGPLALANERRRKLARKGRPVSSGAPLAPFAGASALNTSDPLKDDLQRERELQVAIWQAEQLLEQYGRHCASLELRASIRSLKELRRASERKLFRDRDFGASLSIADLQAYPVHLRGVVLDEAGNLDEERSFATVNYFRALTELRVSNTVYPDLTTKAVDFAAARLPAAETARAAVEAGLLAAADAAQVTSAVLVYGAEGDQIVLLVKAPAGREARIAALPVASLRAERLGGAIKIEPGAWRPGLPMQLVEDPSLAVPPAERAAWLSSFHSDREWLEATHRTAAGLSVLGLVEVFSLDYEHAFEEAIEAEPTAEARLVRRFELRRRKAMETDLFLHASPHWHFNVKDFNAGGNHGGFSRQSMNAVLWLKGGAATRVQPGPLVVDRAYDGLDFAPTILEAAGVTSAGRLPEYLVRGGFRPFPGRVAREALTPAEP